VKFNKHALFILVVLCGICGGSIPAFAKIALESFNPGTLILLRYIFTLVFLIIFFSWGKRVINWRNVKLTLPVSVFAAVNAITFAIGISHVKASAVALLYNVVPLMVALLSWIILKERMTWSKIVGLLIGFIGVMVVALAPYLGKAQNLDFQLIGAVVIFIGALGFSLYSVLSKPVQDKVTPGEILIGSSIVILACQAVYMLVTTEPFSIASASWRSWGAVLEIFFIGTVLFYGLFQYILKASSPTAAASMTYVQPAAGALWAMAVLGDRLSLVSLIGGLISLIGVAQVHGLWNDVSKKLSRNQANLLK